MLYFICWLGGVVFTASLFSFRIIFKKDGVLSIDKRNPEKYIYRFDFKTEPMDYVNRKIIILKVDTKAILSSREDQGL